MATIVAPDSETQPRDTTVTGPTSVYLYYDNRLRLLYVGVTSRGIRRQAEHNLTKLWWGSVARQDIEHYSTRAEALARESSLIRALRPPYNVQQNPEAEASRLAYEAVRDVQLNEAGIRERLRGRRIPLLAAGGNWRTPADYGPFVPHIDLPTVVEVCAAGVCRKAKPEWWTSGAFLYMSFENARQAPLKDGFLAVGIICQKPFTIGVTKVTFNRAPGPKVPSQRLPGRT